MGAWILVKVFPKDFTESSARMITASSIAGFVGCCYRFVTV